jgi:hypothetical protein
MHRGVKGESPLMGRAKQHDDMIFMHPKKMISKSGVKPNGTCNDEKRRLTALAFDQLRKVIEGFRGAL